MFTTCDFNAKDSGMVTISDSNRCNLTYLINDEQVDLVASCDLEHEITSFHKSKINYLRVSVVGFSMIEYTE